LAEKTEQDLRAQNLIAAETKDLQILLLLTFAGRASFVSRLCHNSLPSDITLCEIVVFLSSEISSVLYSAFTSYLGIHDVYEYYFFSRFIILQSIVLRLKNMSFATL